MVYCPKCGTKNNDEDLQCRYCGSPISKETVAAQKHWQPSRSGTSAETKGSAGTRLGEESGRVGKRIGEEFGRTGKSFEEGMRRTGGRISSWYDQTLGLFGPMIFALVSLVMLVVLTLIIMVITGERRVWVDLTNFVITYLPLFFILGVMSAYSTYFSRHYHSRFKWVAPATTAVSITAGFWIVASMLTILDSGLEMPYIGTIASWISLLLPVIFIVAITFGYLGLALKEAIGDKIRG